MSVEAGTGARRDAVEHRRRILDAARQVFTSNPRAGLASVASTSGLTRTTVYAHYGSREALLEALISEAMSASVRAWDSRGPHDSAAQALEDHLRASWRTLAAEAMLREAVADALPAQRVASLHAPLRDRVLALLRRAREEGAAADDVSLEWQAETWFALIHAAGRAREPTSEGFLVLTLLRALSPGAPASAPTCGAADKAAKSPEGPAARPRR